MFLKLVKSTLCHLLVLWILVHSMNTRKVQNSCFFSAYKKHQAFGCSWQVVCSIGASKVLWPIHFNYPLMVESVSETGGKSKEAQVRPFTWGALIALISLSHCLYFLTTCTSQAQSLINQHHSLCWMGYRAGNTQHRIQEWDRADHVQHRIYWE